MLSPQEVLALFQRCGALLEGHFLLTSGLHSPRYLQCALVLQYPEHAAALSGQLAGQFHEPPAQLVVAPALGGIIVAHEVARALGTRALFTERQDGRMTLRRGFGIQPGERAIVVEDVVTTGGSTREVIQVVRENGGVVTAAGCLVDRSGGRVDLGVPLHALVALDVPMYAPDRCPLCQANLPLVKPGSRSGPPGGRPG